MDGYTIDNCLKQCEITRPYYKGIYSIDTIPYINKGEPYFIIVNTDIASGDGKHWIVLFYINSNYVEIFDSLEQSTYAYGKYFKQYIKENVSVEFIYTNKRIQNLKSNVCGAHCLFYSYKKCQKKLSLYSLINRYYLNDTNYND